ncbi:unnamed protein product [marine sediment metagenome]|uniref:Uncharacterized protein n=1 Tax=marine sediment metagenome TaxID=412755 RepID=X1EGT7_9ZZZZ
MAKEPKTERGDYDYKKDQAMNKLAGVLEGILEDFFGEENARIREDVANYTIGYLGVSFGLHVER